MSESTTSRPNRQLTLDRLSGLWAVTRLPADAELPEWLPDDASLVSVTRTADELSILAPQQAVPDTASAQRGFSCLRVRGPLAFSEIGILAALAGTLAAAGVSLFAISTFDTDYLLLPQNDLDRAIAALGAAGHTVQ